jgi:hypothetical protein
LVGELGEGGDVELEGCLAVLVAELLEAGDEADEEGAEVWFFEQFFLADEAEWGEEVEGEGAGGGVVGGVVEDVLVGGGEVGDVDVGLSMGVDGLLLLGEGVDGGDGLDLEAAALVVVLGEALADAFVLEALEGDGEVGEEFEGIGADAEGEVEGVAGVVGGLGVEWWADDVGAWGFTAVGGLGVGLVVEGGDELADGADVVEGALPTVGGGFVGAETGVAVFGGAVGAAEGVEEGATDGTALVFTKLDGGLGHGRDL